MLSHAKIWLFFTMIWDYKEEVGTQQGDMVASEKSMEDSKVLKLLDSQYFNAKYF